MANSVKLKSGFDLCMWCFLGDSQSFTRDIN